jgi:putative sigma-54 modulation protein
MRIEMTGRHVAVSPGLRTLVTRKLDRVRRRLNNAGLSATVVASRQRQDNVVEVTLHARGEHFLHAVGKGKEWEVAANAVVEKLERQAEKLKTRWTGRKRRTGRVPAAADGSSEPRAAAPARPALPRIVRASRYSVRPMTAEEAAMEMEGLEAAFLVYRDVETGGVNVVYRRKNGQIGLIEPEA